MQWSKIAKEQEAEISNLAKEFITKRDQGIWNKFNAKDLLRARAQVLRKPFMLIVLPYTLLV